MDDNKVTLACVPCLIEEGYEGKFYPVIAVFMGTSTCGYHLRDKVQEIGKEMKSLNLALDADDNPEK